MPHFRQYKTREHIIDGEVVIAQAAALQDIWEVGGIINLAQADGEITAVSDSADDTLAGTGAQRIVISGNAAEAKPKFLRRELDMAGETPVTTTGFSFQGSSLAQARVIQSNDLERTNVPTGTITLSQGGTPIGKIEPNRTQTHHGFRRIPYGPDGEVETWKLLTAQLSIRDLAGKADASAILEIWKFNPTEQAHADSGIAMQAAIEVNVATLLGEDFVSGETFAMRINCDQTLVRFFVNVQVNVTIVKLLPVVSVL